jgi:hypothetical protein
LLCIEVSSWLMVPFGTRLVWTSGPFVPNALRHPEFFVSYKIGSGICVGIGSRRMRFPVAAK